MYRLWRSGAIRRRAASVALGLLALVASWLALHGSPPQLARDFEECFEQVQAQQLSYDERGALMIQCNARFAGRRKAGGGYTYYDFMQDRSFDIADSNPTAEELKQIDRVYMAFLDAQGREVAELARRSEQFQAELERARQPVGPPLVLTPRNLSAAPEKRPADRSKSTRCGDGSLTCTWAKLSAAVKTAFASSSKSKR
jgi:hypothetical protein